jgi:arylsulfatase A
MAVSGRRELYPKLLHGFTTLATFIGMGIGIIFTEKAASGADSERRPNIVFILADDMGYGDLGCYGHPMAKTPHIDNLARQGVRFTQHYSNGTECSPTRAAFLTGRYQQRAGGLECAIGTGNVGRYDEAIRLAEQRELGLPADQTLIPGELNRAGYACGVFGKWHLGYEPHFNPMEHGWDEFFGYLGGNVHYFNHRETSNLHVLFEGRLPVYREGYMTHLITDASIDFVQKHRSEPFFVYVAHESPHFPFQGPEDVNKVVTEKNWMEKDPRAYVAMLEDLDSEVGRLLTALDETGTAENTVVVFASDNGGLADVAHMDPLSGAKSTTLEGGIRVPLIIRWPNRIKPGLVSHQLSTTFDLTASFLALAQTKTPTERLDGFDVISHVARGSEEIPLTRFWRGKRGNLTWCAAREMNYKFVRKVEGTESTDSLYDLSNDMAEQNNLLATQPVIANRLRKSLNNWEAEVQPVR